METFLGGKVMLHRGNCLEVLPTLPENSIDSCVTDPPYHLTSIVKRFGKSNLERDDHNLQLPSNRGGGGTVSPYKRCAAGFMGKQWDGGDIAQSPELWAEVYRVLKPGAHLLAFGGTRTFHRMAVAIEDAGFEIRDTIMWLYATGFPKSHDVSKGIDKAAGAQRETKIIPTKLGNQATRSVGPTDFQSGFRDISQAATPEAAQWEGWGTALKPACELIILARKPLSEPTVAANVLRWGTGAINVNACRVSAREHKVDDSNGGNCHSHTSGQKMNIPSNEHQERFSLLSVSDNPHSANVSECVHDDQQSLNLRDDYHLSDHSDDEHVRLDAKDGQVSFEQQGDELELPCPDATEPNNRDHLSTYSKNTTPDIERQVGRWPANLIHDGSEEVVRAFPDSDHARGNKTPTKSNGAIWGSCGYHESPTNAGDSGSAARFFYSAKADGDDRLGSKHPTIKPVDLMQYLVRLITPPRGFVLDPFAGTGSTGEAAWREGMSVILIEREDEYCTDICRRMQLVLAGPDERLWQSIKARGQVESPGPLFDAIEYDANDDFARSIDEAYAAIRARKAAGGKGWPE